MRCLLLLLLLLLFASGAIAQPTTPRLIPVDDAIEYERKQHNIPAIAIALVDASGIIDIKAFGEQDPVRKLPATKETLFPVGSLTSLLTRLTVLQLVEEGKLELDVPITRYLPDFRTQPAQEITIRQLLTHRSGLMREPPVGHSFDRKPSSLQQIVASLNNQPLSLLPNTETKRSHAAMAVLGRLIEVADQTTYREAVQRRILKPFGLSSSDWALNEATKSRLAQGRIVTAYGKSIPVPVHELGNHPAQGCITTVGDLALLVQILLNEGKQGDRKLLKPETLSQRLDPKGDTKKGLVLEERELLGLRRVGEQGSIDGYSVEIAFLPDDKLGVVVLTSLHGANAITARLADFALSCHRASRKGQALPVYPKGISLGRAEARRLAGAFEKDGKVVNLFEMDDRLFLLNTLGGQLQEVLRDGPGLFLGGLAGNGMRIAHDGKNLTCNGTVFQRIPEQPPSDVASFRPLIGEYGREDRVLYLFEHRQLLYALVDWCYLYPLSPTRDPDRFEFPQTEGIFAHESLVLKRYQGKVVSIQWSGVDLPRRAIDGEDGKTFRIVPLKPVAELRAIADKAQPPEEKGTFRETDLVDLAGLDATIRLDLRYASDNNFLSTPLYPANARAYMQRPAAESLLRAHRKLKAAGYGLWIHDAYRPWSVTRMFWDATPEHQHLFVADPSRGSRHNRGCAVDLTLYELKTGRAVTMVSGYDEFSDRAFPYYFGGTTGSRQLRTLLRHAMEDEGFTVYEAEWWHFDYRDWRQYRIGNSSFDELARRSSDPQRPSDPRMKDK